MWGFSVEAELVENSEKQVKRGREAQVLRWENISQDELCCYVSRVEERSVAMDNGTNTHNIWASVSTNLISDRHH